MDCIYKLYESSSKKKSNNKLTTTTAKTRLYSTQILYILKYYYEAQNTLLILE